MTSTNDTLAVIYEDNHLLVVNKPAPLPTMGVAADRPSLLSQAKQYIRQKYQKAGNVYLGIVSRLDAPVTGVVVIRANFKSGRATFDGFSRSSGEKNILGAGDRSP